MTRTVLLVTLCVAAAARSQVSADREIDLCRQAYDLGKFGDALKRAQAAVELPAVTPEQQVVLHEVAGLSAFNLGDQKAAKSHFLELLKLDPDHELDPFAVAPVAIKAFEQVRKDNAQTVDLARQARALERERARREKEAKAQAAREEEEERRRREELGRTQTIRTVEKRPLWVNFVPFGAGQFQQGRTGWGVTYALSEGLMALASVVAYFVIGSLFEQRTYVYRDRLTPEGAPIPSATSWGIPPVLMERYQIWTVLKYSTGIAFYALWAVGAGDALWHHTPEVVTETRKRLAEPPKTSLQLFPLPGGLGAGFTLVF